jgi:hypothetical protein
MEISQLCRAFVQRGRDAQRAEARAEAESAARRKSSFAAKQQFHADDTQNLVSLLARYSPDRQAAWEFDMIIALKILRAMVGEWRSSASDEVPPDWLLNGVPSLVVQLFSMAQGGDGLKVCCLELGAALLHGGDIFFQAAFLRIFEQRGGRPEFFEELQRRLRSATEEDKRDRLAQLNPQLQVTQSLLATRYRSLHSLVVEAARRESSNSYVEAVLRFLHLLCEGHNAALQNYLRYQPNSPRSVNVVAETANYVDSVTRYIGPHNVHKVTAAMNAISEFVQNPCRANQRVLVDTRLCASANELLALRPDEILAAKPPPSDTKDGKAPAPGKGGAAAATALAAPVRAEEALASCAFAGDLHVLKAATATCLLSLLECVDEAYIPERMLTALEPQQACPAPRAPRARSRAPAGGR